MTMAGKLREKESIKTKVKNAVRNVIIMYACNLHCGAVETESWSQCTKYADFSVKVDFWALCRETNFTAHRKRCICYGISVHVSDRPSVVRHTPVLCQNEGTLKDAVFTVGYASVYSFLMPQWLMADDLD